MTSGGPIEIYQALLDRVSGAVNAQDVDVLRGDFTLPLTIRSAEGERVIESDEEFRRFYGNFFQDIAACGANQVIRLASRADLFGPDHIEGWHVTHVMHNAQRLAEPFLTRVILRRDSAAWKIVEIDSVLKYIGRPGQPFCIAEDRDLSASGIAPGDARLEAQSAMALYQDFLDRMSKANLDRDFETYSAMIAYPLTSHTDTDDAVYASPCEARPFFDVFSTYMAQKNGDHLERTAERAEFLSGTRICGYHDTMLYSRGAAVYGPVKSRMVLERQGTGWFLKSITNSLTTHLLASNEPDVTDRIVSLRAIQERTAR